MIDRISWVDLREQYLEIPHQTAITQDNAAIAIDFIIFYKVLDPLDLGPVGPGLQGGRHQHRLHHIALSRRRHDPRRGPVQARTT